MTTFADLPFEDFEFQRIFFPHSFRRLVDIAERQGRFVHYTSAEVAMSIIQDSSIWMRNALTMNDFSEVQHGLDCLYKAWREHEAGERFRSAVDEIYPGISEEVATLFDGWQHDLKTNTFLTCLSEHLDSEDDNGRLSMWRAYGGRSGVALVLNTTPFLTVSDELGAYSSSVAYFDFHQTAAHLDSVAAGIRDNAELILRKGHDVLLSSVFAMLKSYALCTKHPGFEEEREWRIIYSPTLEASKVILPEVRSVRGIPQVIQKIPLRNSPEEGLHGAALPDLLDRLIIGPTEDQVAVYDAFKVLLAAAGVPDPVSRIRLSGIPLRQ